MDERRLRRLAAVLGLGSLAFGVAPALAPDWFARRFGLPAGDPTVGTMVRSIGVRDAVIGLGLWSAATHGGRYRPWLLARLVSDLGDTVGVALAVRSGARDRRFLALGALALGAAATGLALYLMGRRTGTAG